jgi:hypothetical protein
MSASPSFVPEGTQLFENGNSPALKRWAILREEAAKGSNLRRERESNPLIAVLQTAAFPLGYPATQRRNHIHNPNADNASTNTIRISGTPIMNARAIT